MNTPRDRLLHLTDFHFWKVVLNPFRLLNKRLIGNANVYLHRRHEFLTDRAESYADHVAGLGIPDILLTGDFASTALEEEFQASRRFVERLVSRGMRPIVIPGNHDVYTFESVRARRFQHFLGDWLPSSSLPCRVMLPGETPLVLVPTVRPNLLSSRGAVDTVAVQKVHDLLSEVDGPVLVAGHYPVLHETKTYSASPGRRLLGAEGLRAAMGTGSHSRLYLSGHTHRFSFEADDRHANLHHLTTASFFWRNDRLGTEGEFCEVQVGDGELLTKRHLHRDRWTVETLECLSFE